MVLFRRKLITISWSISDNLDNHYPVNLNKLNNGFTFILSWLWSNPKPFTESAVVSIHLNSLFSKQSLKHIKKTFDAKSASSAEMRCTLPHPTKSVVPIRRDDFGTDFVCLCCRTEFRLPKMAFYEAGVNSMLTGHCFVGQHTLDKCEIGILSKHQLSDKNKSNLQSE